MRILETIFQDYGDLKVLNLDIINSSFTIILGAFITLIGYIGALFLKKESFQSILKRLLKVLKINCASFVILLIVIFSVFRDTNKIFNFSTSKQYIFIVLSVSVSMYIFTFVWCLLVDYIQKKNQKNKILKRILILAVTFASFVILYYAVAISTTSNFIISGVKNSNKLKISIKNKNKENSNYYITQNTKFGLSTIMNNKNYASVVTINTPAETTLEAGSEIILYEGTQVYLEKSSVSYMGHKMSSIDKQTLGTLNENTKVHLVTEAKVMIADSERRSNMAILLILFLINVGSSFIGYLTKLSNDKL